MTGLDDLRLLRAFVHVAESGSISAAARVLGLTQPTLSRRIQALERSVNAPLIRRDTHSMSLTETGRVLLTEARMLLAMTERVEHKLAAERHGLQGHLRIVSIVDVGQWIVARTLAHFQAVHPEVTAELHLLNRPTKFVEEGFDCGFLVGEPTDQNLVMRPLVKLPRILVAAPSLLERHRVPEKPEDLAGLPWLGVLQPHFEARSRLLLLSAEEEKEIAVVPTLLLDTVTALRQAALAGAGFTMLPTWMVGEDLAAGALQILLPDWNLTDIDLCVGYASGRHT
ncbi:MAG: LysR family transcriptional regulator, partial [Verrucomicrobiaceae bacterium]|nr:LysR family transcriptional regulator [Verrucomicrobiaceae bacterium]